MRADDRGALRALMIGQRQAALGTVHEGAPFVSMVLFAVELREWAPPTPLIHVSRLSAHTRYLQVDPRASLMIAQPDVDEADPQTLPRVSIQCLARAVHIDAPYYQAAKDVYLTRLPGQAHLFNLPDFTLFRLVPQSARYVGGFGVAFTLDPDQIGEVLSPTL